jgi:hypothetical protein
MKRVALAAIFLVSCKKEVFVPIEREYVQSIGKCDSFGRCKVISTLGREAVMHAPYLEQEICRFMKSNNVEMADYFFACEKK